MVQCVVYLYLPVFLDITRKARIIQVVYNASNNELVRTNTLVKNTIVVIDATSFKQWYITRYGIDLGKKKHSKDGEEEINEALVNVGEMTKKKRATRAAQQKLDPAIEEQFASGRLLACISSRPGQIGRADGYLLEGPELQFYKRKLEKKKSK